MWEASATYGDGTYIKKYFTYKENGNYYLENERQQELEAWLMDYHENCTWYSVIYVDPDLVDED